MGSTKLWVFVGAALLVWGSIYWGVRSGIARRANGDNKPNHGDLLPRLACAGLIIVLYAVSITLNVFLFRGTWAFNSGTAVSGGEILLYGWLGILVGMIGWYANVLFVPGLILFAAGEYRVSRWIALAALLIASSSLLIRELPTGSTSGASTPIASFGPGFYAWLGSMVLLTAGTFGLRALSRRPIAA
jgi:hypothetical protein